MAKYQKYAEYQDSGLEWLGEIPSHWVIQKLKWEITAKSGTDAKSEDGEFDLYGANGLIGKSSTFIDLSKLPVVLVGRVGSAGSLNYLTQCAGISDNALIIENNKYKTSRFEFYLLSSLKLEELVSKNAQPLITASNIRDIIVPISLDINERTQIANFLDHETAKIDSLIEKQQQLIQLLKEKRQAVISHAVTKGLNPNVPMKDSGVEWLGEVPEHWTVCRLKHVGFIQSGIAKGKDLTGKSFISVPMLRVANVQDGYLNLDDVHHIEIEKDQLERYLLQDGDVLMNEGGDNDKLGRGAVWRNEIPNCIHQNHVFAIRTNGIEPEWLDILTRASYAKFHFYRQSKQSTNLASISSTNIKETPILVPPKEERDEIRAFLKKKSQHFSNLEEKCFMQVELLKERRTALISAAVTGKIDVQNWQNPNNNNEAKMEFSA